MKVFTVVLQLSGKRGGLSIPQIALSTKEAAEDAVRSRQNEMMQLMGFPIVRPTGADGGEPVMSVKQFLNFLGLETVGHFIDETEVRDGERIQVASKIIVSH